MTAQKFLSLDLKYGDLIYIVTEKGEGFTGTYENGYDSSKGTFNFSNFSNGQIEIINLEKLQDFSKV